jgi:hypothetical protein
LPQLDFVAAAFHSANLIYPNSFPRTLSIYPAASIVAYRAHLAVHDIIGQIEKEQSQYRTVFNPHPPPLVEPLPNHPPNTTHQVKLTSL